jgi:hypothetical protein
MLHYASSLTELYIAGKTNERKTKLKAIKIFLFTTHTFAISFL